MQFRTKARAVDLLGKGQIADLPTAITELWKNGYDAYADKLTAEIYLEGYKGLTQSYFLITDDGKGMSENDILNKWLVLGTDSKSRAQLEGKESEETLWKKPRIKAGEKGIGRLSVAYLGNPMLMLTKKIGYPLQLMFFDWRLLENYNLFLSDIIIPVKELESISEFQISFNELKNRFLSNFEKTNDEEGNKIWEEKQNQLFNDIVTSVENAKIEDFIANDLLDNLTDIFEDHGTKFFIFEPIRQILELTEKDEDLLEDKQFVISSLTGFTNPFKQVETGIITEFPIHQDNGYDYDLLITRGNFFTEEDFSFADVEINGIFDGDGTFKGILRFYDQTVNYQYINPRKKDKRSFYGSVYLRLGYSLGEEKSSFLDEASFKRIKDKVELYGGLYIYRDDFRVLPYGRENADFLGFEGRRSRRAGSYFFSYRRMYGYIDISREQNPNLRDKSSREGLINNAQYRAFVNDATSFFVELAKDYFGTGARESLFLDQKKLLNEQFNAIQSDKAREKQEKIAFTKSLNSYPQKLKDYQEEYESLLNQLNEKINQVNIGYSDIEAILDRLHKLDAEYGTLKPKIPKRYKPTDTQLDRLDKYSNQLIDFQNRVFSLREPILEKAKEKLEIRDLKIDFTKKYLSYKAKLESQINNNKDSLQSKSKELIAELNRRSSRIIEELTSSKESLVNSIDSKDKVSSATLSLEKCFEKLIEDIDKNVSPLVNHVKTLSFDLDEELIQGAYKAEYENIKYQWEQTRDTAQLGIAVEIIDHEFNQLYARINRTLDKLNNDYLESNNEELYHLTKNFQQLESKYALLSPLYRISGAVAKTIPGIQIFNYLNKFFENSFIDYEITLEATNSFKEHAIDIKEPIIHTVYINIVNNAIYWLRNVSNRIIKLDYCQDTDEILILNSGQKIEEHRLDKIFQLFYSNRPNGRGIGLYLTKQSLNESGFDIYATNEKEYNSLKGACFVIKNIRS